MSLTLRAGLSWCICARQAVFLDLLRDRYFCLPDMLDGLFQRWASGETIDGAAGQALIAAGVAEAGSGPLPTATLHRVATRDLASGAQSQSLGDTLGAIAGHLHARRRLRRHSLASLIAGNVADASDVPRMIQEAVLRRIAGAFATSAMVLRAADQCLPRAIAAKRLCRRRGQDVALIFGVRLHPFAAHSWVQAGDAVIVGDLEQVRLYTPILVVR